MTRYLDSVVEMGEMQIASGSHRILVPRYDDPSSKQAMSVKIPMRKTCGEAYAKSDCRPDVFLFSYLGRHIMLILHKYIPSIGSHHFNSSISHLFWRELIWNLVRNPIYYPSW